MSVRRFSLGRLGSCQGHAGLSDFAPRLVCNSSHKKSLQDLPSGAFTLRYHPPFDPHVAAALCLPQSTAGPYLLAD